MIDEALATILILLLVTTIMILIIPYVIYPDMIKDNVIKHIGTVREGSEVQ
jgi:hypothetical protein